MNYRAYLLAAVSAELRAKMNIARFEKEMSNGNQNKSGKRPGVGQNNNAQGNVPQRPATPTQPTEYGG